MPCPLLSVPHEIPLAPIPGITFTPPAFPERAPIRLDAGFAYWAATLTRATQAQNFALIAQVANARNVSSGVQFTPTTIPIVPGYAVLDYPDGTFVVVAGTATFTQLLGELLGAVVMAPLGDAALVNGLFGEAATLLWDTLGLQLGAHNRPVYFVGHSYGAAVAQVLAVLFAASLDASRVRGVSAFGCPKPGNAAFAALAAWPVVVVENVGDAVPFLPPQAVLILNITPYSVGFAPGYAVYRPAGQRYFLDAAGRVTTTRSDGETRRQQLEIVGRLMAGSAEVIAPHFLREYVRRLQAQLAREGESWRQHWRDTRLIDRANAALLATGA